MSRIFMPAGWISGTRKSNDISQDGVFAEHDVENAEECEFATDRISAAIL
jgi:hypothetical protein